MFERGVRQGVEMGDVGTKSAQNTRQCLVTRPSYYIIYIIILYNVLIIIYSRLLLLQNRPDWVFFVEWFYLFSGKDKKSTVSIDIYKMQHNYFKLLKTKKI